MKIIDPSTTAQNITFLPEEILELILQYCRRGKIKQALSRDLASFCLVSRSWYAAGVKHLYLSPLLTSRNFKEFASTICPSTSNRSRRVGLERLVEHIDMGALAYESSRAVTSRLLSRTKLSLRSFVSPAVSFSTSCLAPLSKCVHLQHLDLSHDRYDFDFLALARTLSQLHSVTWLSLPKLILALYDQSIDRLPAIIWPQKLHYLQINENVPDMAWKTEPDQVKKSLPASLRTLRLQDVTHYHDMTMWTDSPVMLPQVTEVLISIRACEDQWFLSRLLQTYPHVQKATVAAMTTWQMKEFDHLLNNGVWTMIPVTGEPKFRPPQELEILILEASPDYPSSDHINVKGLKSIIRRCPSLLRVELPSNYLDLGGMVSNGSDVDELNKLLSTRAEKMTDIKTGLKIEDCGIFAGEHVSQGVGLKRSVRARDNTQ